MKHYLHFWIYALLLIIIAFPQVNHAAEDQFIVHINIIATDTDPPTVPGNVNAVAVSTSQINVSWTDSVDNTSVIGYHVFRDNDLIATTTIPSYADTGLLADTTYAYEISAFDFSDNESAKSATSTATTFKEPVIIPNPGGEMQPNGYINQSGSSNGFFFNLKVVPDFYKATIIFNSSRNSVIKVFWGKTPDYEIGGLFKGVYNISHNVTLDHLTPDTVYYFKIEAIDGYGAHYFYESHFTTKKLPDKSAPPNVSYIYAERKGSDIVITWKNPPTEDFAGVRILRSEKFYPKDIYDGRLVYEGGGTTFTDKNIEGNVPEYYTIFAKDTNSNYSSGAVVAIGAHPFGLPFGDENIFKHVIFINGEDMFLQSTTSTSTIILNGEKETSMQIPKQKLSPDADIVVVRIKKSDGQMTHSLLLSPDKQRNSFYGDVGLLNESGSKTVILDVLDFKNNVIQHGEGIVNVKIQEKETFHLSFLAQILCKILNILKSLILWINKAFFCVF
jgi:hypothetical protein